MADRLANSLSRAGTIVAATSQVRRYLLPAWFAVWGTITIIRLVIEAPLGSDSLTYLRAAQALVSGHDPWRAGYQTYFAAPPPTLLPYLPLTGLPDQVVGPASAMIALAATVWTLRHLNLPAWWLLFPPIIGAVWSGNPQAVVVALLVAGKGEGIAVLLKVYAAIPLFLRGRWRPLTVAAAFTLATAPFLAWPTFLADYGWVAQQLREQSAGGFAAPLPLVPVALVCLFLLGRERASWLAVPALWPAAQLYYATIALPVLRSLPIVAASLAVPVQGFVVVGLVGQVLWLRHDLLNHKRRAAVVRGPVDLARP